MLHLPMKTTMINTGTAFRLITPQIQINGPISTPCALFQPVCVSETERDIGEWEIDAVRPIGAKDQFSLTPPVFTVSHQLDRLRNRRVQSLKYGPRLFEDRKSEFSEQIMLYADINDESFRRDPVHVLVRMMEKYSVCQDRIATFVEKVLPHLSQALLQNALLLFDALDTNTARCAFLKILASKKSSPSIKQIRLFLKLVTKYRDQFHDINKYVENYFGDSETRNGRHNGLYFELEVFDLLDALENVVIHNVGYEVGDAVIDFFVSINGETCLIDAKATLSTLTGFRKTRPNRPKPVRQVRAMLTSGHRTALITKSEGVINEHDLKALSRAGVVIINYQALKRTKSICLPQIR